ncbi:hypothetical protein BS329_34020 [Amycolatopsis coloradensis]|uniref:Metallo-beta-lactamase domain-containing protein n=1 Tax=Amycolatopsis coloradensis TaxID=76021 RepID=A0A1R0KI54_9PSEU|nr:hypothetical protein [Amycolatopsis coloradensis]OLZ45442.1 hypothetical protein BS329_34020 [Amycolatopsis coloradensis]
MPVEVIFFNVGQGDSTFLFHYDRTKAGTGVAPLNERNPRHTALLDCGSTLSTRHLGGTGTVDRAATAKRIRDKLEPYLQKAGKKLDDLLISHPDEDHFNILKDVVADSATKKVRMNIGRVHYTGGFQDYREGRGWKFIEALLTDHGSLADPVNNFMVAKRPRRRMVDELVPLWGGVMPTPDAPNLFLMAGEMYGPLKDSEQTLDPYGNPQLSKYQDFDQKDIWANISSLVLVLIGQPAAGGERQKLFLMADALRFNEDFMQGIYQQDRELVARERRTWLKMGHHGSFTSTFPSWLNLLKPDVLLMSSGTKKFGPGANASGIPPYTHLNKKVLPAWRLVNNGRTPIVLGKDQAKPLTSWHNYYNFVDADNLGSGRVKGTFHAEYTKETVFTSLWEDSGAPATPAGNPPKAKRAATSVPVGVDWHLVFDDPKPGDYAFWYE